MADVTVKKLEEMDAIFGGGMVRVRGSLGVTSFGMQVATTRPTTRTIPTTATPA